LWERVIVDDAQRAVGMAMSVLYSLSAQLGLGPVRMGRDPRRTAVRGCCPPKGP